MAVIPKMLKMQEGCFVGVNLTRSNAIEWQFVQIFKLVVLVVVVVLVLGVKLVSRLQI